MPKSYISIALVAFISTSLLIGALFFEFVIGLKPCPLCVWQRIPHLALSILSSFGLLLIFMQKSQFLKGILWLCLAISISSLSLGIYHAGIEWGWWIGPSSCGADIQNLGSYEAYLESLKNKYIINCAQASWRFLGLSLAGYNAIISAFLIFICAKGIKSLRFQ